MPNTYVSNRRAPEWRVAAEQQHLIIERQHADPINAFAVGTACGLIITPSAQDTRMNAEDYRGEVPRCRACEAVEDSADTLPPRTRLS